MKQLRLQEHTAPRPETAFNKIISVGVTNLSYLNIHSAVAEGLDIVIDSLTLSFYAVVAQNLDKPVSCNGVLFVCLGLKKLSWSTSVSVWKLLSLYFILPSAFHIETLILEPSGSMIVVASS